MKSAFFALLLFYCAHNALGQTRLAIEKDLAFADLRVEIAEDQSFPDIKVKIGTLVAFEDLSVGFAHSRTEADFVISKTSFADKRILYGKNVSFEDLKICAGEHIAFPDITIRIKNAGSVDYLIYSEKGNITREEIVLCLLEAIKRKLKIP